jgi:anti-anti-sigma regulatory factor
LKDSLEKQINENIDQFLTYFFISYSNYKDELLATQRKMVDDLSVPIIPINREICILPLIGTIDLLRLATIQDKVLTEIENHHIRSLIIDLSGVTPMEQDATNRLIKIIEGISMMGCETFLTGLRAEIVKNLINIGVGFNPLAKFKGNLQQALNDVINDTERKS